MLSWCMAARRLLAQALPGALRKDGEERRRRASPSPDSQEGATGGLILRPGPGAEDRSSELRLSSQSYPLVSRAIIFRSWPGLHGCSQHSSWQELPSACRMRLAQLHADPRLLRDEDPLMRDPRVGAAAPSWHRHWDSSLSQQLLRDVLEMRTLPGFPTKRPSSFQAKGLKPLACARS